MDKNAIKKYAVWARTELITRVSQRAEKYDITAEADGNASSVNGVLLSDAEKKQRKALIDQLKQKGFDQVMEEVAYTWFNRFIALRFMEVNGYLPSHIRVFTDDNNAFKPQILAEAIHLELDGLDMDKVYEMKNNNENDELYKYLIIVQCNDLSKILPGMFQKIADYTELLFPDNVLREGSVIEQMVTQIPEADWNDQVQIIGWLYQYYNSEPKDRAFADLKNKKKITKDKIPAATQLFTPDWIVRYMVENSLGRLWSEGHNISTETNWNFFVSTPSKGDEAAAYMEMLKKRYSKITPDKIRCIDPCMGSGHVLAYMFDVLVDIYQDYGIQTRDAVRSIVENNIWGLDIDERSAQLAYFSVMMKAVQYDRRFLVRKNEKGTLDIPSPNVFSIKESNLIDEHLSSYFANGDVGLQKDLDSLKIGLSDAKEYGSIIKISNINFDKLYSRIDEIKDDFGSMYSQLVIDLLKPIIKVGEALSQKYDIVVTNPPYMGNKSMSDPLTKRLKKEYPDSKTDMYSVFMERCCDMLKKDGLLAMITQQSWMFLSSFEKLRSKIINKDIITMAHLGARAFEEISGEIVQTTSFVVRNSSNKDYIGVYKRLVDYGSQQEKEIAFSDEKNNFYASSEQYKVIPGFPIAYWIGKNTNKAFNNKKLEEVATPVVGMFTTDNDKYLRLWWEVNINDVGFGFASKEDAFSSEKRYFPYNKGGGNRRWYGNAEYVVLYENGGSALKELVTKKYPYLKGNYDFVLKTQNPFFEEGITWSDVGTGDFACRYTEKGYMFDVKGSSMFPDKNILKYMIGYLNSKFVSYLMYVLNPTMSFQIGNIKALPFVYDSSISSDIETNVEKCITLAKEDWDSYETSWDFKRHPLLGKVSIKKIYEQWKIEQNNKYVEMINSENIINRNFADIYNVESEIDSECDKNNISVRVPDLKNDIKSLVSYIVGCMFGRYSIDNDGVIYAGGEWNKNKQDERIVDFDNIIPICDDEYFEDDIVSKFINIIGLIYGADYLEENLKFIADSLGQKGAAREGIRNYFINDFYKDHVKTYEKCPIYWEFSSGKKNGFKCLVYVHRYQSDTIARIRTDYVHELQSRYRTAIKDLERRVIDASTSEKVKINKKITKLKEQSEELYQFEEKVHHLADRYININLDSGIKKNYEVFKDVLEKIK